MKATCLGWKMADSDFWFLKFYNTVFPFKVGSQLSALKLVSVQPRFTGALAYFLQFFFTYSKSPLNSLLDKGLTCKNYSMGIGFVTVWKKLLANAHIRSSRGGHHHITYTQINPSIILYKI